MSFSRYSKYKEIKNGWSNDIPEHWKILPCRGFVDECTKKNENAICQNYLSLMANVGVIPYEEKGDIGNKKPEDLSKCKVVHKGNFVINSMNYGIGSYGVSAYEGVCSPVYVVLMPKSDVVEPGFAFRVFEDKNFQAHAQSFGNGILAHRCSIGWDDLKGIAVGIPPTSEQKSILNFLDRETAKIDALISEQKRLIELLQEKRQAVISHAVTKGLNPDAPMKKPGVGWLGEVPKHWKAIPLRHLLKSLSQGSSPPCLQDPAEEGQYGVLKVGCVNQIEFLPGENKGLPEDVAPDLTSSVLQGDVLMSRGNTRELVGLAAVVQEEVKGLLASDLIFILRFKEALVLPEFATLFLRSDIGRCQIEPQTVGTSASMQKINQSTIKGLTIVLPPLNEQREISESMNRITKKYSDQIHQSSLAIELLQERRSALISAAVTGQIDVRSLVPEEEVAV